MKISFAVLELLQADRQSEAKRCIFATFSYEHT
jgi:hypothetical protein